MKFEALRRPPTPVPPGLSGQWSRATFGQRAAEAVARLVGSWTFIIGQSIALTIWVGLNVTAVLWHWDPYPFILLNLGLSLQAAYTAPMILMAQNRQAEHDRAVLYGDYAIVTKTNAAVEEVLRRLSVMDERLTSIEQGPADQRPTARPPRAAIVPPKP